MGNSPVPGGNLPTGFSRAPVVSGKLRPQPAGSLCYPGDVENTPWGFGGKVRIAGILL
jgi:hypothetical protein